MTQKVRRRSAHSAMGSGQGDCDAEQGAVDNAPSNDGLRSRSAAKVRRFLHRLRRRLQLTHMQCFACLRRTDSAAGGDGPMRAARRRHKNGLALLVVPYLVLGPWLQRHGVLAGWRGQAVASAGKNIPTQTHGGSWRPNRPQPQQHLLHGFVAEWNTSVHPLCSALIPLLNQPKPRLSSKRQSYTSHELSCQFAHSIQIDSCVPNPRV